MTTVRPGTRGKDAPGHFTDTRTVVIVLVAVVLSLGVGLTARAVASAAHAGPVAALVAAVGAGGTALVMMISTLDRLIAK